MAISPAQPFSRPVVASALAISVLVVVTVAVWLHNRDILRDVFDYSTVIVAAGKVEAGLKPYTGVRSPMQSSVYLLNYGTEQVFGRNYLALTWGGLVQALGGGLLLFALVRRKLGAGRALLLALAIVLAGLLQHLVFFYNPIGILCFSVVLLGLAVEPALWPVRSWRTVAVAGALFLGGINKLNFQGITVGLAALLTVGAWAGGRITRAAAVRNALGLALAGVALPLAFELAWTGASLRLWFENVVLLPSERRELLGQALDAGIYLRPARDFHHHLLVRPIAGIGLAVFAATGLTLILRARAGKLERAARALLLAAGLLAGALLMITNNETVMLTSLAYPVLAVVFLLNFPGGGDPVVRRLGHAVFAATLVWVVAGGYAAWHGSRLLYGANPPPRSSYARVPAGSPALAYFAGVRMPPEQIDAHERMAARLQALAGPDGKLRAMIFGPGLDWLERAYPEAIVPGAPISYNAGVSLHERDVDYFAELLEHGRRRLVAQRGWQSWPTSFRTLLARDYREERVSARDVLYNPRPPAAPAADAAPAGLFNDVFRDATGGNVLIAATRASAGLALQPGPAGTIFGAARSTNWAWPLGTHAAEGKAVARLQSGATAGQVIFRALAGDPENGEVLWEIPVTVSMDRPEVVVPVALQPGGRPVWLQTEVPGAAAATVFAGWREMRITHTNEQDRSPPRPYGRGLGQIWPVAAEPVADQVWFGRAGRSLEGDGWAVLPAEDWRRDTMQSGKLSVTAEFVPDPANPGDHLVVTLAWYRGSRFEIMTEKEIDPRTTPRLTLEAYVPEPGGWVGLLTRTGSAQHRVRVGTWAR